MVVISDHYDINKETMFDVTRLTSFLEKDASFLTPWSWDPKTSSTKEKKNLSFHPESYFSYEIIDDMTTKKAQVNYNQCPPSARSYSQVRYSVPLMFFNQAPNNFRSYSQAWCLVPLMFYNQAPIYCMIPIVIETIWRVMPMPMPLSQIQNPSLWM
ncbi:hypothetical protein QL285_087246 [Trifolium repens]|nr:hypothetical protein QL285_087246 [Trifolium repens]